MRKLIVLAVLVHASFVVAQPVPREPVLAANGMVVCVSPPAAEVGVAVLKKGGNAVDAAVAVAFAQAVTWPEAGNIGGGGFMMIAAPGGAPTCIEYRETAPAAATETMFAEGKIGAFDHKVAGVPGTVRGLEMAHRKYGKLPWSDVVMPAVLLAERGFAVNEVLANRLNPVLKTPQLNAEFLRVYGKPGGALWRAGDTMTLPDLGRSLRLIAERGPDAFYSGELADMLDREMKAGGGLITKADLANYKAVERVPIHTTYRGYDVYAPPPPCSGGIALCEMLNMLETFDLKKMGRWSPEANHRIIETMKRAYRDRAAFLGDPAFAKIPEFLTAKDYAKKLASTIDPQKATPSESLSGDITIAPEGNDTTHFSVIDKDGLAVSNTYTLENSFGNRVVVHGAGYILNNEMTDFNPKPGVTTRVGLIGTKPNLVAPGKRMLSSQTPTLILKGGKPVLVTGSPGGRTIINTVLCVVLNAIEYDMPITAAVDAPRMHHQWFPDVARYEGMKQHPDLVEKLRVMGHTVSGHRQGDAHSIWVDAVTGKFHGAADKRIDGLALGF